MDELESLIKEIRKIYQLLFNKECDLYITFKGTSLGVSPYNIRIDNREANGLVMESAANELLNLLKKELAEKISRLESEASHLRKALGDFKN